MMRVCISRSNSLWLRSTGSAKAAAAEASAAEINAASAEEVNKSFAGIAETEKGGSSETPVSPSEPKSARTRRISLRRLRSREQNQVQQQEQQQEQQQDLMMQQLQAVLRQAVQQQEEGVRDDDEVEALGASMDYVGQTIESSKVKYQWELGGGFACVDHKVEFFNSKLSGRKKLFFNEKLIYSQQQLRVSGFEYSWPVSGHLLTVVYDQRTQSFALTVNGLPFQLFYRRSGFERPQSQIMNGIVGKNSTSAPQPVSSYQQSPPIIVAATQQQDLPQQQQPQQRQPLAQCISSAALRLAGSSPTNTSQVPDDVDLLDLVSSTGCPSPPAGSAVCTAGAGTGVRTCHTMSRTSDTADAELSQLDGTFWTQGPATPDFPTPAGGPEPGVAAGQLPAFHLPVPVELPPAEHTPHVDCQPNETKTNETSDAEVQQGNTGPPPRSVSGKPSRNVNAAKSGSSKGKKGESLFADLMELASDKLKISLSPRTSNAKEKPTGEPRA